MLHKNVAKGKFAWSNYDIGNSLKKEVTSDKIHFKFNKKALKRGKVEYYMKIKSFP